MKEINDFLGKIIFKILFVAAIIFAGYFMIKFVLKKIGGVIAVPVKYVEEKKDEVEKNLEEMTGKIIPLHKKDDEQLKTKVKRNLFAAALTGLPGSPFPYLSDFLWWRVGSLIKK